jgi:BlaI family transcriptional regulator, penicillinase repressor
MSAKIQYKLSRRESQLMEILHSLGEGSASQVRGLMDEEISDSAVRTFLRRMVEKGVLKQREAEGKFFYSPVVSHKKASRSALRRVLDTFFAGRVATAVAALVDENSSQLTPKEFRELEAIIKAAKSKSRDGK